MNPCVRRASAQSWRLSGLGADRLMYLARRDRPRQGEPCALATTSTSTYSRRTHHHVMRECGGVSSSCSWMTCSGWCRRRVWRTASCLCWGSVSTLLPRGTGPKRRCHKRLARNVRPVEALASPGLATRSMPRTWPDVCDLCKACM